jgi:predicted dehydrogenase
LIKVGVIGLGRMGMLHLLSCKKIGGVEVIAVADASKGALKKAKALGVDNLYQDYRDLLVKSSGLDAVIISLPNFLHLESVSLALETGLNVFIEKPLARNVNECREIVNLTEKTGRKLQLGNVMRFENAVKQMKAKADNGFVGSLEVITIEEIINGPFSHPRNPAPVADWWFDAEKSGGGVLLDLGCHLIDLFRFFVGEECGVEFSSLDYSFNLPVEDGAIVVLRSSTSSVRGIINVGWYQKTTFPKFDFNLVMHGNSGYMSINDFRPRSLYVHAAKEGTKNILRRVIRKDIHPLAFTYLYEGFYDELVSFFECIRNDGEPAVSAIDGLKTIELIDQAYRGKKTSS